MKPDVDRQKPLTPQQEAFVRVYLESGNASKAYRTAYDASNTTEAAVNVNACKLKKHPKIAARIEELRDVIQAKARAKVDAKIASSVADAMASGTETAIVTMEQHLLRLQQLASAAEASGKYAAAITAEVKRGEALGFYTVKSTNVNLNYAITDDPQDPDAWASKYADRQSDPN